VETSNKEWCRELSHYRRACPQCGGPLTEIGRVCFGMDQHIKYMCDECYHECRTGLLVGSPYLAHDDEKHILDGKRKGKE